MQWSSGGNLRFCIGSELLRFAQTGLKGCFSILSIAVLVPHVSRVPLSRPTSIEDTLSSSWSHSSMQNQRKCSLLWTLKSNGIPFVSLSVAGPNLFTQHQQSTNNHLSTASCPPGTSPALNQLFTTGGEGEAHSDEHIGMFTLTFVQQL